MHGRRNSFVAREGLPFLGLMLVGAVLLIRYGYIWPAIILAAVLVVLVLIFRDPRRSVPPIALGVISPVDGVVVEVRELAEGALDAPAHKVVIAVDSWGTYTARSPVEGEVKDLGMNALWLQTDEEDDVVLKFGGYRFGLPPLAFVRFGERLGQGQRCAYLRLARKAEVQWPLDGTLAVAVGDTLVAGCDVLGSVPNPR